MKKKHIKILIIFMVCICLILGIFILRNYFFGDNIISKRNEKYLSEANGYIYMHNKKNVKVVDNEKINISKKVKENHIYDLFKFENAQIYSKMVLVILSLMLLICLMFRRMIFHIIL